MNYFCYIRVYKERIAFSSLVHLTSIPHRLPESLFNRGKMQSLSVLVPAVQRSADGSSGG